MRRITYLLTTTIVFGLAATAVGQTVNAGRGDLPLMLPSGYDANTPTPLIVLLHGYTSSGEGQDAYMNFSGLVDDYGFMLLAPDGTEEEGGREAGQLSRYG